ncbi:MAG: exodeoxyribonuclease VII small subunit [Candidatus Wildermuthbacteria bacterium]|nr:exodeoxyribonuclease VII small subunit [Candidatus Wildermuthbacteria bacterium]
MTKEKETIQAAKKRLEQIIEELSRKDVDVELGLEKFKEGVELITFIRAQLQKTENEFKKLKAELEIQQ